MIFLAQWAGQAQRKTEDFKKREHMAVLIAYHNLYVRQLKLGREIRKGTGT